MSKISPSFEDTTDFENANRGLLAALKPCIIKSSDGHVVWNNDSYDFLKNTQCADTANPKLWRQAQLCSTQGLFLVTDGIYQVRGLDISNMTLIEGNRGVIVIDPLISVECAEAALNLYREHRGHRKVVGMLYTHSHGDHFGGARAVLGQADNTVPIIAPEGFMHHAVSENLFAGPAMTRRGVYMYGDALEKGPDAQLSAGLGQHCSAGASTLIRPTIEVFETGHQEIIDGVRIVFQMTPGTEAPAELNFYIPDRRALCMAENATHTLHNILTLRGALIRDAQVWSHYLDEAIVLFGHDADVLYASHHWPTWGRKEILRFLSEQRDLYAFLHDQTLRMMNQGLTGIEIAEDFVLPEVLQQAWHAQGFYGSVSHNVKAIYQRYMGWYDGNPAHLWEHPPAQAAKRYIDCMGGVEEVVRKACGYSEKGDLRFTAQLLSHAVFAEPSHNDAREALASVLHQLGRGAENGPWRNIFMTGAAELRGNRNFKPTFGATVEGIAIALSTQQLLQGIAFRINGVRAQTESCVVDLDVQDEGVRNRLILSNGALTIRDISKGQGAIEPAGFSCTLTKRQLLEMIASKTVPKEATAQKGDSDLLGRLLSLVEDPDYAFNIVIP